MPGPILEKASLWRDSSKGLTSRFSSELEDSIPERDDISDIKLEQKLDRGGLLQRARLKRYPSINVEHGNVYAGRIDGDLEEATDRLQALGFRNNPTAYVEVSERNGPDDGSYSKVLVTESSNRLNPPMVTIRPSLFRRVKDQIHVVVWETSDGVEFGAHRERHAWLQPARHVAMNDSDKRVGVRDFRDMWYDTFESELEGKSQVRWDTTH